MADFLKTRTDLQQSRTDTDAARLSLGTSSYRLKLLQEEMATLERQKSDNNGDYRQREIELNEKIAAEKEQQKNLQATYSSATGKQSKFENAFRAFDDPRVALDSFFFNNTPFFLFPLRIETRFKSKGDQAQLWVRVYPDECMVDSFEPLLSANEVNNAARFWAEFYSAGTSPDPSNPDPAVLKLQKAAWALLVSACGDGRAAWITSQLKPDVAKSVFPLRSDKTVILAIATDSWNPAAQPAIFDLFQKLWFANGNDKLVKKIKDDFNAANPTLDADKIIDTYRPVNFDEPLPSAITKREDADLKIAVAVFDDLAGKAGKKNSWSQPSRVNLMPERLGFIRFKNNAAMDPLFGNTIPFPLTTSPDPDPGAGDQLKQTPQGDIEFAESIRWLADFEQAVKIGMGIVIDLARDEENGFERLLVLGVRISSDAADGRKQLENLFEHHYYSKKGFTLLPQGTPTNNTGSSDSGYTGRDNPDQTFDQYFNGKAGFQETDEINLKSDGQWFAEWLGLDYEIFKKVLHSDARDQADCRNLNTALWPATMGYVMGSLMEGGFSSETFLLTRDFFSEFVSGRGPVPAIRIGDQPYGILPTAPFRRLQWMKAVPQVAALDASYFSFLDKLYNLLLNIDADWNKNFLGKVPFVGRATETPYQDLLDILVLNPNSVEFHRRYLESLIELKNKVSLIKPDYAFNKSIVDDALKLLKNLGYATEIMPQSAALLGMPWQLPVQLIDDQPLSEENGIRAYTADKKNYLEALILQASKSEDALRTGEGLSEQPIAELYRLLKYALELGYHRSAVDAGDALNAFSAEKLAVMRTEQPFVHQEFKKEVAESRYAVLYATVPAISTTKTVSAFIRDSLFQAEIPVFSMYLAEQLKALDSLKNASTARLERAFVEHLDCCSYRADSWKTGVVTAALAGMRNNRAGASVKERRTGIYLGAFGWLENVSPEKDKVLTPKQIPDDVLDDFNPDRTRQFVTDAANEGYIHAPSLNQGVTAAVLRNGYISHGKPDANNVLAVNLSSERIRLALSVIEGIQGGQSLAALLGYHFERTLHERADLTAQKIDSYVYAIRKLFPLNANKLKETALNNNSDPSVDPQKVPITAIEARNVVDGSNLANFVKTQTGANKAYPFGLALPGANNDIAAAITGTVNAIIDVADAIGDLGMAESVHQVVMGNVDRASGVLESYSKGNYPQTPDVIKTPRSGPTMTHRVAIPFNYVALDAAASPRAQSEPSVNHWLMTVLPKLNDVVCVCSYTKRGSGLDDTIEISLQDIGLDPLDLLYMIDALDTGALNELDDRLLFQIHTTADPAIEHNISLNYIAEPLTAGKFSVFQVMPLLKSLRALIVEAKPLGVGDVSLPNEVDKKSLPAPELESNRTKGLADKLKADLAAAAAPGGILDELRALPDLVTITEPQMEAVRANADVTLRRIAALLLTLGSYGIPQTGIGGLYAQQQQWYLSLKKKVADLADRWKKKSNDYDVLVTDLPLTEEKLLNLERLISTSTTPGVTLPIVAAKKNLFDIELAKLDAIVATRFATVFDLVTAIRLVNTAPFDSAPLDISPELRQVPLFIYDQQARLKSLTDDLLNKKIPKLDDMLTALPGLSPADQAKQIEAAAQLILGEHFKMFPRFAMPPALGAELANSWNDTDSLLDYLKNTSGYFNPTEDWLHGVARVHEKMKHFENCILLREAFGLNAAAFGMHPVQLPYKSAGYYWMAMAFPPDKVDMEKENTLLYTAFTNNAAVPPNEICGALADEWTEIIPATQETTGVTFHYDRPSCEAPQAMLLVTPAQFSGNWQWNDLVASLLYTMDAAKTRAIQPDYFKGTAYATLLPAVIGAESTHPYSIVLDNRIHYAAEIQGS